MIGDSTPQDPGGLATGSNGSDPRTALFLHALLNPAGIPDQSNQVQPQQNMLLEAITRKLSEGQPQPPTVDPSAVPAGPNIQIGNDIRDILPPPQQPPPMQPMPPPQAPQGMPPQGMPQGAPMPPQGIPQDVPQGVGPPAPPQMMAPGISGQYQATGAYGQPMDPAILQQLTQNPDPLTQMMMGGGSNQ